MSMLKTLVFIEENYGLILSIRRVELLVFLVGAGEPNLLLRVDTRSQLMARTRPHFVPS